MIKELKKAFLYELLSIKKSFYKLFLISVLPVFSFALIIAIFYKGVLRDIPIVVVDNDKTTISKRVLFHINSSSTIDIKYTSNSLKDAIKLLQNGSVYGVVVIPHNFYKNTILQKQPKVTAILNTQYILIGKILTSALTSTVLQSCAEIEYVKNLTELQNPHATLNLVSPIKMQVTPFFNTYQNYFLFLVSALLPAIWQIFIVVATIVSFGSLFKAKEEMDFFKGGYIEMKIIGKLLPYTFAYLFLGVGFLSYIYIVLGWDFQGSWGITVFAMFLTVVAYEAVALLFFVTGFDYARTLSLGAVYTAPAFAFLGVTFPVFNMNGFALLWRDLLPISHYMELQISQANYGADIGLELKKLFVIFCFWLAFIPVFYMFRKKVSR
jgi:ABC-2 type transport system permease protein